MDLATIVMVTWFPALLHLLVTGYVAVDAPKYGMSRRLWGAIAFLVPMFGFFAYLFERDERTPDPDRDMFTDGVFEIHESRADDTRLAAGGPEAEGDDPDGPEEGGRR